MSNQSSQLAGKYTPAEVEPPIDRRWQEAGAFHAEPADPGEPYAIVIPPPNVTAALHMGHALNNTLQDILIRWRRMQGRNALWMPGTDHAGIATQTVVEKRVLQDEGKRRTDFKREQFVARIQAWKDVYEERITDQLKVMGCSCDWDRRRFTMDPVCASAVREAFFRLFSDGLIYRGKRLVNWDPATQTALADDEVVARDVDGSFWYLRYPLVEPVAGIEHVTVATTRPETMLGDTAVAVNPRDPRAEQLVGRQVRLPIVNRIVPIIADDCVVLPDAQSSDEKAKFSSGFLKVTPAHDPNDWEVGLRHDLPVINVFGPDGSISREHGWPDEEFTSGRAAEAEPLLGMSREEARKAVVRWFEGHDLLDEVRPYRHSVGHSYRSHVPVEPYLSDQWYVKVTDDRLAGAALKALAQDQRTASDGCTWKQGDALNVAADVEDPAPPWHGGLRFHPQRYAKTFQDWHENLRDWCISRQLWWGHQIPVWRAKPATPDAGEYPNFSQDRAAYLRELQARFDKLSEVIGAPNSYSVKFNWIEGDPVVFVCSRNEQGDQSLELLQRLMPRTRIGQTDPVASAEPREFFDVDAMLEDGPLVHDPDVLDTWFSSALWPISTLGWPQEEANEALSTWNPSHTLCTAREIITLWVSRMTMFNIYLRKCLPFRDVFIHAMIQDGHGQKMSKSLGNGVDPVDIIHSHGADAMRFTLTSMTTQTQDVRLPVDVVCPHTGQVFTPKFVTGTGGHRVAAAIQTCPTDKSLKMVSSYGVASGKAEPDEKMPAARNTSEKFDLGRNFANKLWNAVRFALGHLEAGADGVTDAADPALTLPDRWVLSRLTSTIGACDRALEAYEFKSYGDGLYDFVWRDFCDWYVEAIKPTVGGSGIQRGVLATVIDVMLRLLHPIMPYVTEALFEHLNRAVPQRVTAGFDLPMSALLARAAWPKVDERWVDPASQETFGLLGEVVTAIRKMRTAYKVPPRESVDCSATAPAASAARIAPHAGIVCTLVRCEGFTIGPDVVGPDDAAVSLVGEIRIHVHGLVQADEERRRIDKRLGEVHRSIGALRGRLGNKGYLEKAPVHLVEQTRGQLEAAEKEAAALEAQAAALG